MACGSLIRGVTCSVAEAIYSKSGSKALLGFSIGSLSMIASVGTDWVSFGTNLKVGKFSKGPSCCDGAGDDTGDFSSSDIVVKVLGPPSELILRIILRNCCIRTDRKLYKCCIKMAAC